MNSSTPRTTSTALHPPEAWALRPLVSIRSLIIALASIVLLTLSGQRTQITQLVSTTAEIVAGAVGLTPEAKAGAGLSRFVSGLIPLQLAEVRETQRIEGFDPRHLPFGARLELRSNETVTIDPQTLGMKSTVTHTQVLVEPFGYLLHVLQLMLETLEIAVWGTLIALVLAFPLACLGARNYTPHVTIFAFARSVSSFLRAVPELISALLLVLVFGFGPIAGVLALGLHTAGFLGKFFAEDIENADRAPQDALRAAGANNLKVLRFAVLPQVFPSYLAYIQYVLERNIRTATVLGVVGAGGIGQELKGRFETFDFAHVGTILTVILATVLTLEYLASRGRGNVL